jgi:hypothetical protein
MYIYCGHKYTVSISVWLLTTPMTHVPAIQYMTHRQAEQDFPNVRQVSLHTSNKINLPVLC